MVRNSSRQLPSNKIIWLNARIIFKLNRLQSVFMFTFIFMMNKKQLTQQSTFQKVRHYTIIFKNKNRMRQKET